MDAVVEKKMIDISDDSSSVVAVVDHHEKLPRASSPPTELEPSEEFPILYGLLTAPKSFKPKNSEELQSLPHDLHSNNNSSSSSRSEVGNCIHQSGIYLDEVISMEEADSQNLDFCGSSRSAASSPQTVDSSSNLSTPDENDSPIFSNYLRNSNNSNSSTASSNAGDLSEDESSIACSPGGSLAGGDECVDDNIPTSTTSGFKRKATRLETAIGNIVRRRRVQKRPSPNNSSSVPFPLAPSSPTVSTTCVDPPQPPSQNRGRGRSEILERILRSSTANTVNNSTVPQPSQPAGRNNASMNEGRNNDNNNNECNGYEPYAKLRDLLTMPEDQLVKRRRLEYGINNNSSINNGGSGRGGGGTQEQVHREFSPPRNNILASLLQKGRPADAPLGHGGRFSFENNVLRGPPALVSINTLKFSDNSSNNNNVNDERPYKCSLCDLRFKKLPLLNRHVKTHSHIKRYVCRFCSHAFKRSDNLLAHMRTSCKGIKEADAKFAGVGRPTGNINGQIIPSSSSPVLGQVLASPPIVSRSQLEEALLNLRGNGEQLYSNNHGSSLVSTTTGSPPPRLPRRQNIQPGPDFQSRHSKLLEILSGSPVIANSLAVDGGEDQDEEDMPLPLSLKVERRCSSPPSSLSPSSSSQSQFLRSHHSSYSNLIKQNELPEDGQEEDEEEEENDNERPLDLGSVRSPAPAPAPVVPSVRSRDHPEIVSILSRQPKNVVMMAPDLRKLVGLDSL